MRIIGIALACFVGLYYLMNIILEIWGRRAVKKELGAPLVREGSRLPRIAVIMPAYNEEKVIVGSVRAVLAQKYPAFEIVVVDDGSKDRTLNVLKEAFQLEAESISFKGFVASKPVKAVYRSRRAPNIRVVQKENGGKSDAINAGLNVGEAEYVCVLDADVIMEQHALFYAIQPFVAEKDANVVAVGGNIRIYHGSTVPLGEIKDLGTPDKPLYLLQILEYIRSFSLYRLGWSSMNSVPLISGAFGVFRREIILKLGGYQRFSKGEDFEIILRLHEHHLRQGKRYSIRQLVRPICFTGAPSSLKELAGQRKRWQIGLLSSLRVYRHLLFRPRFGTLGCVVLPYMLIFEALSPFLEFLGYLLLIVSIFAQPLALEVFFLFVFTLVAGSVTANINALISEALVIGLYRKRRDLLKLILTGVLEPFGYHQLNQWWKIRATIFFFRNIHIVSTWQPPQRD
jgi:cellulose synthase/poly-beta-1,6-N-acetylglucosamine synthase-like glycosyltransferase